MMPFDTCVYLRLLPAYVVLSVLASQAGTFHTNLQLKILEISSIALLVAGRQRRLQELCATTFRGHTF